MTIFKKYKDLFVSAAAVLGLYFVFFLLGVNCPIKYVTGVSCAGCGMTRAWLCVLRLDFVGAMSFHPLFWTVPLVMIIFILRKRYPDVFRTFVIVTVVLYIAVYVFRMFDSNCQIVVFEPQNSLLYRIFKSLF